MVIVLHYVVLNFMKSFATSKYSIANHSSQVAVFMIKSAFAINKLFN